MMYNKGLQEDGIQKLDTTEPEQLTDHELFLSTISETLQGNTLGVGTKSIPSVSSEANHTGSGLLWPSVT